MIIEKRNIQKVLILGAGRSGQGAAKLCAKLGLSALLLDLGQDKDLAQLQNIDLLVVSPGIHLSHPLIREAQRLEIFMLSELDFARLHFNGQLIAVTGTNGKSTTTAMIAHILQKQGRRAIACGNIGLAACEVVAGDEVFDIWALEVSSYQLELSRRLRADVAVFTSFSPDHLERHGSLKNYFLAKWQLSKQLMPDGAVVFGRSFFDHLTQTMHLNSPPHKKIFHAEDLLPVGTFPKNLFLKHDHLNASMAASACAHVLDVAPESLLEGLNDFEALPYRYNYLGRLRGQDVFNDSKSTNVDAVLRCLENQSRQVVLMLGGHGGKSEDFSPILKFKDHLRAVLLFGDYGPKIFEQLSSGVEKHLYPSLRAALIELPFLAERYKCPIVFSPGCASFDEFANFEERGLFFNQTLAKELTLKK